MYEDVNERVLEDITETAQAAIDDGEICDMEEFVVCCEKMPHLQCSI